MGNCVSVSLQSNAADSAASRCWECASKPANYVCALRKNLDALKKALEDLTDAKDDLLRKVNVAEQQQQLTRLAAVQRWISRVEAKETEANELMLQRRQEKEKLCLWGCCSKSYVSSYEFGKKVSKMLDAVTSLRSEGVFEAVAERAPEASVVEMPLEPTVGLESLFDEVLRDLRDDNTGIMGLYGMGGVGKTTLLKKINNNFLEIPNNNYIVILVVVSKDHTLEKLQNGLGEKLGFSEEKWKRSECHQKAADILKVLSRKKFVLLLDDIWERVDLIKLGVPLPDKLNKAKVVFTTRSEDICCRMKADKKVYVKSLAWDKSWELFRKMVGEEALSAHLDIPSLAESVAKECDGLPLALITIGRAMACKRTPQEWRHAIQVLKNSASEFSGMGDEVFPLLKFSYDNLSSDKVKSCFLYCALFPEDRSIKKNTLIEYWIGEGFLETDHEFEGCEIIGLLLYACLLEEGGVDWVKMHDVIRDMALWIAHDCGKAKNNFLVQAKAQLLDPPAVVNWNEFSRISLMENSIQKLSGTPTCLNLLTLFLRNNKLQWISDGFFQFMPKLRVLDLSRNYELKYLPVGISKLSALQYLNLSCTGIKELPGELKDLVMLKCLNLNYTGSLKLIPHQLISNFPQLQICRMICCGSRLRNQCDANNLILVQDLLCLEHLKLLEISIYSVSAWEMLFTSTKLLDCTRTLSLQHLRNQRFLYVPSFLILRHLEEFRIDDCQTLEEIKIDWDRENREFQVTSFPRHSMPTSEMCFFLSVQCVFIENCQSLLDLTCLIYAPKLNNLQISDCDALQEIICLDKLGDIVEATKHPEPFLKLELLNLDNLPSLKSIHQNPLPFPLLKFIRVSKCSSLRKLPISYNINNVSKPMIIGGKSWWSNLTWDNEATRDSLEPRFREDKFQTDKKEETIISGAAVQSDDSSN